MKIQAPRVHDRRPGQRYTSQILPPYMRRSPRAICGLAYSPPAPNGGSFTDVAGHWAEGWIEALKEEGISSGYPDGIYRPDNGVVRAEMAVFLTNTFGLPMP